MEVVKEASCSRQGYRFSKPVTCCRVESARSKQVLEASSLRLWMAESSEDSKLLLTCASMMGRVRVLMGSVEDSMMDTTVFTWFSRCL